jgi:hypothetical protein
MAQVSPSTDRLDLTSLFNSLARNDQGGGRESPVFMHPLAHSSYENSLVLSLLVCSV